MIPKHQFGHTGNLSSRIIFGAYALSHATKAEADWVLDLLLESGINHIDTASMYGDAEKLIGPWMEKHRSDFFLATKSRRRTCKGALDDLSRSLDRLRTDHVDLWQMHGLTNPAGWGRAMGPGGTLEAFVEAQNRGMVRFLGVTGHGIRPAAMHIRSLERFDFDSVMLPCNYSLMQDTKYAYDFEALVSLCRQRKAAIQIMKSIARWPRKGRAEKYNTYFYEPLDTQEAIDIMVHWVLAIPDIFIITAGDMQLLPMQLDAASRFENRPAESVMSAIVEEFDIRPIFS